MAKLYSILESKRIDSQAFLMARFCDDMHCLTFRVEAMAKKNDDVYRQWKVIRDYIHFLYNNKPHRIKGLLMLQDYTKEQVDIIWDIAHRDNEVCYLLLMAAFSEWDKG